MENPENSMRFLLDFELFIFLSFQREQSDVTPRHEQTWKNVIKVNI